MRRTVARREEQAERGVPEGARRRRRGHRSALPRCRRQVTIPPSRLTPCPSRLRARSPRGSDHPPDGHSLPRGRYATPFTQGGLYFGCTELSPGGRSRQSEAYRRKQGAGVGGTGEQRPSPHRTAARRKESCDARRTADRKAQAYLIRQAAGEEQHSSGRLFAPGLMSGLICRICRHTCRSPPR